MSATTLTDIDEYALNVAHAEKARWRAIAAAQYSELAARRAELKTEKNKINKKNDLINALVDAGLKEKHDLKAARIAAAAYIAINGLLERQFESARATIEETRIRLESLEYEGCRQLLDAWLDTTLARAECSELAQAKKERDAFANEFGGGNIVSAMVNCRAAREENLKLSAGDYLLNEIGAALGCAPDATILERIAEQARQLEQARYCIERRLKYHRNYPPQGSARWDDRHSGMSGDVARECDCDYCIEDRAWLAANAPTPQAEQAGTAIVHCEHCSAEIKIVSPEMWTAEKYATCGICGERNSRSSIVIQMENAPQAEQEQAT